MSTAEAATIIRNAGNALIAGPGAARVAPLLAEEISSGRVTMTATGAPVCSAATVALLGEQLYTKNGVADIASLEPFYLKDFFTTAKPVQTTE